MSEDERYFQETPDGTVHERPVRQGFLDLHHYLCGAHLAGSHRPHDGPATCKGCKAARTATGGSDSSTSTIGSSASPPSPTTSSGGGVEDARDGWPDGYSWERSGVWYAVEDPDGNPVDSGTPSGKFNGEDAAQEAAWGHAAKAAEHG